MAARYVNERFRAATATVWDEGTPNRRKIARADRRRRDGADSQPKICRLKVGLFHNAKLV